VTLKTTGVSAHFGKARDCRLIESANNTMVPIDNRNSNVQSGVTSCNNTLMTGKTVPQLTAMAASSRMACGRCNVDARRSPDPCATTPARCLRRFGLDSFRHDQRKVTWSALVIRRHRTAPTVSACLRNSRTRSRQAADGAWAISSSHVSSTAALNLARSACAAWAR